MHPGSCTRETRWKVTAHLILWPIRTLRWSEWLQPHPGMHEHEDNEMMRPHRIGSPSPANRHSRQNRMGPADLVLH